MAFLNQKWLFLKLKWEIGQNRQTDRETNRQILWHYILVCADFLYQLNLLPPYSLCLKGDKTTILALLKQQLHRLEYKLSQGLELLKYWFRCLHAMTMRPNLVLLFFIHLPPEFLPASGPAELWCASTLGIALLISSRVGSELGLVSRLVLGLCQLGSSSQGGIHCGPWQDIVSDTCHPVPCYLNSH